MYTLTRERYQKWPLNDQVALSTKRQKHAGRHGSANFICPRVNNRRRSVGLQVGGTLQSSAAHACQSTAYCTSIHDGHCREWASP